MSTTMFNEGKSYFAEYTITCRYKGITSQCGTECTTARCVKRTECYATFEVLSKDGSEVLFTKRGRIYKGEGTEIVYLTNNGRFKDMYIMSEQEKV